MQEYLTTTQYVGLLERATAPRDSLLLQILYETGCTVAEVVEIKGSDIDAHTISIGKRQCRVSTELVKSARTFYETHKSAYLFATRQSPQMSAKRAEQLIKKQLRATDALKKAVPQVIRYTHIVHAHTTGVSIEFISAQTGLTQQRIQQIVGELVVPQKQPQAHKVSDERTQLLIDILEETAMSLEGVVALRRDETQSFSDELQLRIREFTDTEYVFSSRQSQHISAKRAEQLITAATKQKPQVLRYRAILNWRVNGQSIQHIASSTHLQPDRVAQIIGEYTQGTCDYEVMLS